MTAAVEETGLGQAAGKAATLVRDSVKTVIAASMVGTAIEFYDFYAYGTAAANYFPHIFFSAKDNPTVALLMSLLTFAGAGGSVSSMPRSRSRSTMAEWVVRR